MTAVVEFFDSLTDAVKFGATNYGDAKFSVQEVVSQNVNLGFLTMPCISFTTEAIGPYCRSWDRKTRFPTSRRYYAASYTMVPRAG